MDFKILSKSSNEKGNSFENLMATVLDKLEFTKIDVKVRATGEELDITAIHKTKEFPLVCECKAFTEKIDPKKLNDFWGKFNIEKGRNNETLGIFFSTSGYTGPANRWYDENIQPDVKVNFKLYDYDGIILLLQQADLLISNEDIDFKILSKISGKLLKKYVVFFDNALYIVQTYQIDDDNKRFIILSNNGNLVTKRIHEQIKELDSFLTLIPISKLEIIDKILLNLLDLKPKTKQKISEEINEIIEDVDVGLTDLLFEKLINYDLKHDTYSLNNNIDTLEELTKRFSKSKIRTTFMNSAFIDQIIDDSFIHHIETRFMITFPENIQDGLKVTAKIFPSVLHKLLFSDNKQFINYFKHKQEINLSNSEETIFDEGNIADLIHKLLIEMLKDIQTLGGNYLDSKKIEGVYTNIEIKAANQNELIFFLQVAQPFMLFRAGGTIAPGQMVSASDLSLRLIAGTVYMQMSLFDIARTQFEYVIQFSDNEEWLTNAWSNTGLCFLRENNFDDAEPCFDQALEIDENVIEVLKNKALCRKHFDDVESFNQIMEHVSALMNSE